MKFQGSQTYVATQDLMLAVNAAITLKRPLLVKGEPGTGKTAIVEGLALAIANREVPDILLDKRILSLDLALVVAGSMFRGEDRKSVV